MKSLIANHAGLTPPQRCKFPKNWMRTRAVFGGAFGSNQGTHFPRFLKMPHPWSCLFALLAWKLAVTSCYFSWCISISISLYLYISISLYLYISISLYLYVWIRFGRVGFSHFIHQVLILDIFAHVPWPKIASFLFDSCCCDHICVCLSLVVVLLGIGSSAWSPCGAMSWGEVACSCRLARLQPVHLVVGAGLQVSWRRAALGFRVLGEHLGVDPALHVRDVCWHTEGLVFPRRGMQSFLKAMPPQLVGGFTRQLMPGFFGAGSTVMASGEVQLCFWLRDGLWAIMPATAGVHVVGRWGRGSALSPLHAWSAARSGFRSCPACGAHWRQWLVLEVPWVGSALGTVWVQTDLWGNQRVPAGVSGVAATQGYQRVDTHVHESARWPNELLTRESKRKKGSAALVADSVRLCDCISISLYFFTPLSLSKYISISIYIYILIYIHICIYISKYLYTYIFLSLSLYIYIYISVNK